MLWRTPLGLGGSSSEPLFCDLADGLLVVGTTGHIQQLPQVLVAEDPFRVLAVPATLHRSQQQCVFELHDQDPAQMQ